MGGITVALSGNFKQILPVIPKETKADEIRACLKFLRIWQHVKSIKLKTNMTALLFNYLMSEEFPQRILFLGERGASVDKKGLLKPDTNKQSVK